MVRINIVCTLKMLEDFHIGTGVGSIGLYDDSQYKDHGIVSIRETSLKGLLRDSCRQINRFHANFEDDKAPLYFRLYQQVFESHSNLNSLDISITPKPTTKGDTIIHFFTAVDQASGTAKAGSLRSIEFGSKDTVFDISIDFTCEEDYAQEIASYLCEALRNLKSLGGYRRRGFGALEITNLSNQIIGFEADQHIELEGNCLQLVLQLQEDTVLAASAQSGNMLATNDYIPGTTILGMLRAKLMSMGFEKSYLNDDSVKASFFYPLPKSASQNDLRVHPVFISLRAKKDRLLPCEKHSKLPIWSQEAIKNDSLAISDMLSKNVLHQDATHTDPGKGLYEGYLAGKLHKSQTDWAQAQYYKASKKLHQRNWIDKKTQSTKTSGVFVENRIAKGTLFQGSVTFKNEQACKDFCRDFTPWLKQEHVFHVGRGSKPCLVYSYATRQAISPKSEIVLHNGTFSISFLSDVILFDENLMPVKQFDEVALATLLGADFTKEDFTLLRFAQRTDIVSSFSGTTGLRKFRDLAIVKGSCYLFKLNDVSKTECLSACLSLIQAEGIGFRKHEGFGEIAINHPVHDIEPKTTKPEERKSMDTKLVPHPEDKERKRLSQVADKYAKSDTLLSKLREINIDKKGKNFDKKGKNFAKMIIGFVAEKCTKAELNDKLQEIKYSKTDPKSTQGSWPEDDPRLKIANTVMDFDGEPISVLIALKRLLKAKGGENA
jgi:CRISPR/Cas system CSM-associated protein Csm3 (group 7 of RAMP superfamily)